VDVQYLELLAEDFHVPPEESALRDAYALAVQDMASMTESRVSHILFEGEDDPGAEQVADALARLAAGESFASLAEQLSDDIGSAGRGGDLGYTNGEAFPADMEAAIAALAPGEVSAPVATDAGIHLLLVTERRDSEPPTFEEMRAELEASLIEQEARIALLRAAETLGDLTFNADDLEGPAADMGLELQSIQGVTRLAGEGAFDSAVLRDAAFSDEVLGQGHNSEVIELSPHRFLVLRVERHNEPRILPLDEVRAEVVAAVREQARRATVAEAADALLTRLRAGERMDALAGEGGYDWQVELAAGRDNFNVAPEVLGRVFELPVPDGDTGVSDYLLSAGGDAVVIELFRVREGSLEGIEEERRAALTRQVTGENGSLVDLEYRQGLRQAADISVL
jgi:peptidyl-prolyl cis-trans isomerase D